MSGKLSVLKGRRYHMFFKKEILGNENFYTKYITNLLSECSFQAESNKDVIKNMHLIESHITKIEPNILKLMIIHAESHEQKLKHVQLITLPFLLIIAILPLMFTYVTVTANTAANTAATTTAANTNYNLIGIFIFILYFLFVIFFFKDRKNLFYTVLFKEIAKECLQKLNDKNIGRP